jgi:hypothetical protein
MLRTTESEYEGISSEQSFGETPFFDPRTAELEEPTKAPGESQSENFSFTTPFMPGESLEAMQSEAISQEMSEFGEIVAEMKDALFREALEQLADEALETHADRLAGEYGSPEARELEAERVLTEHFQPLAAQAEAMLDRFFERVEGYEAESLTDGEIARIVSEVLPEVPSSPASEQFLGGLLRKAGKLVSGAVNFVKKGVSGAISLAGKGLAAIGKLALKGLLEPLKALGRLLLNHVVKFAIGHLPPSLQPLAQKLAGRLLHSMGETYEGGIEAHEQTETHVFPAAMDATRLEAEFDLHAAQLLFAPGEGETEQLVASYGEAESYVPSLAALDDARAQLAKGLSGLQAGESAQPVMEQFIPAAIWPVAKTAITILGRPRLVSFLADLLSKLIKPLIGADASGLLAPAIADAGLRIFGLEASPEPRTVLGEALAATVEETLQSVGGLPSHVLENEALLNDAVHEAFESAAASYFPNSAIRPELRESTERHGMWTRMPTRSDRKRYAKYSDTIPVEISPRAAHSVDTFGGRTLHDHFRDQHGMADGQPYKGHATLYQVLPGTRGTTIARAEGFPASQLHPLTPQAAGVLLGPNAALGLRPIPLRYMGSPQRLHVNQRLYRLHPPAGRHHHVRHIHSELLINLLRGEIRIWLYLSEPLCQRISTDLAKGHNPDAAFRRLRPLLARTAHAFKEAISHGHLPPEISVVSEAPNVDGKTHDWLRSAGHRLAAKISEWTQTQLAQYLRNNVEEIKRLCSSRHDGVTLRFTMTRVPGLELLLRMSQGKPVPELSAGNWPKGTPTFQVNARAGFAINRLRD